MRILLYIVSIICVLNTNLRAQEVFVDARLDTTDILIGDQIRLNIVFTMPLDSRSMKAKTW